MNRLPILAIVGLLAFSTTNLFAQRKDNEVLVKGKDFEIMRQRAYRARDEPIWEVILLYGGVNFGGQLEHEDARPDLKPELGRMEVRRIPIAYYHPNGPLGRVLDRYNWSQAPLQGHSSDARLPAHVAAACLGDENGWCGLIAAWSEPPIAVVGMWSGAIAAYARPYQCIDFFERVPEFVELSKPRKGKAIFTFIQDAEERGAIIRIFTGEYRATVSKQAGEAFYHVISIECNKHGGNQPLNEQMMTREAMSMLTEKLAPGGMLCYHSSHRHIEIASGLIPTGKGVGLASVVGKDPGSDWGLGRTSSEWVMLSKDTAIFDSLTEPPIKKERGERGQKYWVRKLPEKGQEWRDEHFPLKGLYRGDPELAWMVSGVYDVERTLGTWINPSSARALGDALRDLHRHWDEHSVRILNREKDEKRPAQP